MNIVLVGAGQRGRIYADYIKKKNLAKFTAVVEPNEKRRLAAASQLGIAPENCFANAKELFAKGRLGDAIIIASMDKDHYAQVVSAQEQGYDILLEKPVSPNPQECLKIARNAKQYGNKIVVCHVLRYTEFFTKIKEILDSGRLGRIVSIQHNENIGNFHMAHSFVRGNWGNSESSSPIIMQKSCHDMDLLVWLVGSQAKRVVSFGDLSFFKKENAPKGSALRCCDCSVSEECRFSAEKAYLPIRGEWPATVVGEDQSEAALKQSLKTGPYGRCVFHCDNNVCDSQVSLIEFENGVKVTFNLSGFTNKMCRTIKIMCEHGEIRANDGENCIEVTPFASNQIDTVTQELISTKKASSGHGGGDEGIVDDFFKVLAGEGESRSDINNSIESHLMAYAAEKSRVEGCSIDMTQLKAEISSTI